MEDDKRSGDLVLRHPAWDFAVKVAAPLAVAASACFYLAGYMWHSLTLNAFGVGSGINSLSAQETVATGYTIIVFYIVHQWQSSISFCIGFIGLVMALRSTKAKGVARFLHIGFAAYQAFFVLAAFLLLGLLAAKDSADFEINETNKAIANNCLNDCMAYTTKRGRAWGRLITQTDKRTIIVTRHGVLYLKTDDLISVKPRNVLHYDSD